MCCKSNHFALSSLIIEVAFFQHNFTPRSKIFHGQIFPHHAEKYRDRDQYDLWRHFTWLALLFLRRIATETEETLTRLTHLTCLYMCHAISFMSNDVSDLERFPISQEVMLFFIIPCTNFRFWTFLAYKFCFKPRKTLNGSQGTFLGSFLWLDVSSNK